MGVGTEDWYVKLIRGRVESLEIAADERLIGAELAHGLNTGKDVCMGVTWIKMKVNV